MPMGLEHDLAHRLEEREHERLRRPLHLRQRDRKDDRIEDDLEHLVVRRRPEDALRHRVLDEPDERGLRLGQLLARVGGHGEEVHAHARLHEIHGEQSHRERGGRHDLEIDDRAQRELAHALHVVAVARDAHDERRREQRDDQRLDRTQEDVRQQLEIGCLETLLPGRSLGKQIADRHTGQHGDDDPLRLGQATQAGSRWRRCRRGNDCIHRINGGRIRSRRRAAAWNACSRTRSTARGRSAARRRTESRSRGVDRT